MIRRIRVYPSGALQVQASPINSNDISIIDLDIDFNLNTLRISEGKQQTNNVVSMFQFGSHRFDILTFC